jgi:hypothetical protein
VNLTLPPRAGVTAGFPASARLMRGRAALRVTFLVPGYYRIEAAGPAGSLGWTTVVVLCAVRHRRRPQLRRDRRSARHTAPITCPA